MQHHDSIYKRIQYNFHVHTLCLHTRTPLYTHNSKYHTRINIVILLDVVDRLQNKYNPDIFHSHANPPLL